MPSAPRHPGKCHVFLKAFIISSFSVTVSGNVTILSYNVLQTALLNSFKIRCTVLLPIPKSFATEGKSALLLKTVSATAILLSTGMARLMIVFSLTKSKYNSSTRHRNVSRPVPKCVRKLMSLYAGTVSSQNLPVVLYAQQDFTTHLRCCFCKRRINNLLRRSSLPFSCSYPFRRLFQ